MYPGIWYMWWASVTNLTVKELSFGEIYMYSFFYYFFFFLISKALCGKSAFWLCLHGISRNLQGRVHVEGTDSCLSRSYQCSSHPWGCLKAEWVVQSSSINCCYQASSRRAKQIKIKIIQTIWRDIFASSIILFVPGWFLWLVNVVQYKEITMCCACNGDIVKGKEFNRVTKPTKKAENIIKKNPVVIAVQMKWYKEYCSLCLKVFTDSPAAWLIQDIQKQWPQEVCSSYL